MGVTIKQIAEMANVHRSTVDKVLHKRPGVSDEVRAKVQKIIDDVGYEVNPLGKALNAQKRKRIISVILLVVDALSDIHEGIERACQEIESLNIEVRFNVLKYLDVCGQVNALEDCITDQVDGIVITPLNHPDVWKAADRAIAAGIPVVTANTDIVRENRLCHIGQDATKAGRTAARMMSLLMAHRGHIGIVVGSARNLLAVDMREKGFRQYLEENEPEMTIVKRIITHEQPKLAYEKTKELLTQYKDINGLFVTCGNVEDICQAKDDVSCHHIPVVCYERYPKIIKLLKDGAVSCTISSDLINQGYQAIMVLRDYYMYGRKPEEYQYMDIDILLKENI